MNATVNLQQFGRFHDHWHPKIVATVNDDAVKLVKVQGEFVWHQHQDTDELFLVIDGQLRIQLQNHGDVAPSFHTHAPWAVISVTNTSTCQSKPAPAAA